MPEPWEAERTIGPERALKLVAEQFPEFRGAEVAPFGNGWDNTAVLVGDVVFRFPRRASTVALLETEAQALPALAPRLPLAVPLPRWHGRPTERFPWPFLGHRRLPGETLSERPLPPAREEAAASTLGHFLAVLHGLGAGVPGVPADPIARLELAPRLPRLRERLLGLEAAGVVPGAQPWLDLFEGVLPSPRPLAVPVHGDLYARHLLSDDAGVLCGVIDWGDLHAGDPAADLAVLWEVLSSRARPAFLTAYGAVEPETLRLARLRAGFHAVGVTAYAHATGDGSLLRAGRSAMDHVLED
jgi:aminoglycoside phosphotransferase (APT) family kinase protein